MENIVVFSGAGMSAESGLSTFRDGNGLWDKYPIEEVATPEAWHKDKEKVLQFYSTRMENCVNANPNLAHKIIFEFEEGYHDNPQKMRKDINEFFKELKYKLYTVPKSENVMFRLRLDNYYRGDIVAVPNEDH